MFELKGLDSICDKESHLSSMLKHAGSNDHKIQNELMKF